MTAFKARHLQPKQSKRPQALLESFTLLFYVGKFLGIVAQDLQEFRRYKRLKRSTTGEGIIIVNIILLIINFNLMISVFQTVSYMTENNNLAIGVGIVLTYFSLVMFLADRITGLLKLDSFANIFHELEEIDEDFFSLGITFNNSVIKYRILMSIVLAGFMELMLFIMTFLMYVEYQNWTAWLWVYTGIPTYLNTLDKLWYVGILQAIRQRFEAINKAFDEQSLKLAMDKENQEYVRNTRRRNKKLKPNIFKNKIKPTLNNLNSLFGDTVRNSPILTVSYNTNFSAFNTPTNSTSSSAYSRYSFKSSIADLEAYFTKLCQLHDSLCDVSKQLNEVFGIPILMLMGYAFVTITAQLYFFYGSHVEQAVPALFRPAQNWYITSLCVLYVGGKCVAIVYGNWQTNLSQKETGVCIHRCALAADRNDVYEMVNHLSLKLFNHVLDFNACGYFSLSMSTLFSFCGGISTYLIILIQFNLEEQQVKSNNENSEPMALMLNDSHATHLAFEHVVNGTEMVNMNMTTLSNVWRYIWNTY